MPSLFNTLSIGYSGLSAAQLGVSVTAHNITNAESEGYVRQRVVQSAAAPLSQYPGAVGNGVNVNDIVRIFDSFVYDRFTAVSSDKEYADFYENTMVELSSYFPEIDGVGIKADLQEYYNMWQTFADNSDNESIKLALAEATNKLTANIKDTQNKILSLQSQINDQLKVNIDEVNSLASQLADLNKSIELAEAGGDFTANDLRDKRGLIELNLSKLIDPNINIAGTTSNINNSTIEKYGSYTLSVNGFNIVDGNTFHPLHIESNSANGFYEISYESQDGSLIPIAEKITGGRIGAILDLRGSKIDDTISGIPENGTLQSSINQMDTFAAGLIEFTNNLYANHPETRMESNELNLQPQDSLITSPYNVKEGSFEIIVYDIDGNITASRTISINTVTSMSGAAGTNSIEGQITDPTIDDNGDGNANNNVDDFINFNFAAYASGKSIVEFTMDPASEALGYTFAIKDNLENDDYDSGSNFAGAFGFNRYYDGSNAQDMSLNFALKNDTSKISAGINPSSGDNTLALQIVQQQFERYDFNVGDRKSYSTTTYSMFDIIVTNIGVTTNQAILNNETITAQYNATEQEYASISQVSIDEELTNLIKYQTAYAAASKIITTIDQMMQTLLGIKQ